MRKYTISLRRYLTPNADDEFMRLTSYYESLQIPQPNAELLPPANWQVWNIPGRTSFSDPPAVPTVHGNGPVQTAENAQGAIVLDPIPRVDSETGEWPECPICFETIRPDSVVALSGFKEVEVDGSEAQVNHLRKIHLHCFQTSFAQRAECPSCRRSVSKRRN